MSGSVFTSCKTNTEKQADAVESVEDAEANLEKVQNEAVADTVAQSSNSEWENFKTQAQTSINENEVHIAELKAKMNKAGAKLDANYKKSVEALEQKNMELKSKIDTYKSSSKADWDSFKTEFNSDMSKLGDAFKSLTVDNEK